MRLTRLKKNETSRSAPMAADAPRELDVRNDSACKSRLNTMLSWAGRQWESAVVFVISPLLLGREWSMNSSLAVPFIEEGREGEANHVGSDPVSGDKWFKVSPFGKFASSVPGRFQFFTKEDAEKMVGEFNSFRGRLRKLFKGLPIFAGHPDVDPENYRDDRRHGKIVDLEVREDGLWAKPVWNSLGHENLTEEFRIYPSPVWDGERGKEGFHATRLFSVGLTNSPRIPGSVPVANATRPGEAGAEKDSAVNDGTNENETMDKTKLIEQLGLNADATEEEISAAITKLQEMAATKVDPMKAEAEANEKEKAEAEANEKAEAEANEKAERAANSKIVSLEGEVKKAREGEINARLDLAIVEGRITPADREAHQAAFEKDFEAAANSLDGLKATINTKPLQVEKAKEVISGESQRREKVANAVQEKLTANPKMDYAAAYKAVKNDPEMKPIFEAMQEPEEG